MNNLNDQQILEVENQYWADMWASLERLKEKAIKTKDKDYPYKIKETNGYVNLYSKDFNKIKSEHRYIMEKHLGRKLTKDDIVHHIDHNKYNNHPKNLVALSKKEHRKLHRNY